MRRTLPPWMYEKSSVKHESQRRQRSADAPGQVGRVLDRRAEAGRADEGAVRAGEAALLDLVPARALHLRLERLLEPRRCRACGPFLRGLRRSRPSPRRGPRPSAAFFGTPARRAAPRSDADLDDELVAPFPEELGEGEVEPGLRPWARSPSRRRSRCRAPPCTARRRGAPPAGARRRPARRTARRGRRGPAVRSPRGRTA